MTMHVNAPTILTNHMGIPYVYYKQTIDNHAIHFHNFPALIGDV